MRAVVLAVRGDRAAVAEKDGGLRYIKNRSYEPGQILELDEIEPADDGVKAGSKLISFSTRATHALARYGTSAAAALAIMAVTGAVTVNAAPAYTVTLDVNPSVAMELNIFDRVVGTASNNEEGNDLMSSVAGEVLGRRIDAALDTALSAMRDASYIDGEGTLAVSTVSGGNSQGRERLKREIVKAAEVWNAGQEARSVELSAVEVTGELIKEAKEQGVTPGRVILNREIERKEAQEREKTETEKINKEEGQSVFETSPAEEIEQGGAVDNGEAEPVPEEPAREEREERGEQEGRAEQNEQIKQDKKQTEITDEAGPEQGRGDGAKDAPPAQETVKPPQGGGQEQQPPQGGGEQQPPQGAEQGQPLQDGGQEQEPPQGGGQEQQPPQGVGQEQQPPQGNGDQEQQPPQGVGQEQRPPQDGGQAPPQDINATDGPQAPPDSPAEQGRQSQPPQQSPQQQGPSSGQDGAHERPGGEPPAPGR